MTPDEWNVYDLANVRTEGGKRAASIAPKLDHRAGIWVPDMSSTRYFVKKPEPSLQSMLGRLAALEKEVADLEYELAALQQSQPGTPKAKKGRRSKDVPAQQVKKSS